MSIPENRLRKRNPGSSVHRPLPLEIVTSAILVVAAILIAVVCLNGDLGDHLGLASAVAAGLIVAASVTFWERTRRDRETKRELDVRRSIQQTLAELVGAEFANLALLAPLVDEDGAPLHLRDAEEAKDAVKRASNVEALAAYLKSQASLAIPDQTLVVNAADCVARFYDRLNTHLDQMIAFFISVGDTAALSALLQLSGSESAHRVVLSHTTPHGGPPRHINDLVPNRAQHAGYLGIAARVLEKYAQLMRTLLSDGR